MRSLSDVPPAPLPLSGDRVRSAGADLTVGLLPLLAVTGATVWLLDLSWSYVLQVVALYAAQAILILRRFPAASPGKGLGPPSRITLARGALIFPVAALIFQPGVVGEGARWWIIGLSTVALVMDGVDGWVARRTRSSSPFGARFDMELDAFLILALSILVWQTDRAGVWVLLIGALRYLFVGAAQVWPQLGQDLPPSGRRKTVCVVQGVVLLVALGPIIPTGMAAATAAAGLALLLYSFGTDTAWLVKNGRISGATVPAGAPRRDARRSPPAGSPRGWPD